MSTLRITESVIDQAVFDDPSILEVIEEIKKMEKSHYQKWLKWSETSQIPTE
jgi:hypothetical protein